MKRVTIVRSWRLANTILIALIWLSGLPGQQHWFGAQYVYAKPAAAMLTIPSALAASANSSVQVALRFQSFGEEVAGITFSLDFDPACLAFNTADLNQDRLPDAVRFRIPPQFRGSVSYNSNDSDGELDFVIADPSPPLDLLVDTDALVTIDFATLCAPAADSEISTPLNFSTAPLATFSDTYGQAVEGVVQNGTIVIRPATAAPTPTTTPTLTPPTLTPTPRATTPATAQPTITPTSTPSATPLSPAAPTATASPTISVAPTLAIYLPVVTR